ncbi:hypothetical protein DL96DRAFT_637362 [Flagelloscypha sp. PMI_526]|nr:hypothetical protein DL96DRAFT_637362 [Flagelloscypha sp. PMI_526]
MATKAPPDASYGAYFVGVTLSLAIYGIVAIQVVQYYKNFPRDHWFLKFLVAFMLTVETVNSGIQTYTLFYFTIRHRGNMDVLQNPPWNLNAVVALNTLSGTIIQCFFARRVYILSAHNWILTSVIVASSMSQLALGWAITIQAIRFPRMEDIGKYLFLNIPAFTMTAVTDIINAISLVYYLQIRKSGHSTTNTIVNKLIFMSINNGLLPSLLAFGALVAVVTGPTTMVPYAMCFILTKTYTATLIVSLNARSSINRGRTDMSSHGRDHIKLQEGTSRGAVVTITTEVDVVVS